MTVRAGDPMHAAVRLTDNATILTTPCRRFFFAWRAICDGATMATVAIYSMKGGVGKTTLAVNLAWLAATQSARRTLLWDLDGQAGASFILANHRHGSYPASAAIEGDVDPLKLVCETATPGLSLLPADSSLRMLDATFDEIDRKKHLRRILEKLGQAFDRIILDCPPGLGTTSDQILRGATLTLLPMIPSTLSRRAFADVHDHLTLRHKGRPRLYPVFTMVDRRRAAHRRAVEADPDCPAIPMASAVEAMADRHEAVGAYAPRSPAALALSALWTDIERWLAAGTAEEAPVAPAVLRLRELL
jgi:cellulose biosynthesis protein BcsQ